jgi:hypothetical protein
VAAATKSRVRGKWGAGKRRRRRRKKRTAKALSIGRTEAARELTMRRRL